MYRNSGLERELLTIRLHHTLTQCYPRCKIGHFCQLQFFLAFETTKKYFRDQISHLWAEKAPLQHCTNVRKGAIFRLNNDHRELEEKPNQAGAVEYFRLTVEAREISIALPQVEKIDNCGRFQSLLSNLAIRSSMRLKKFILHLNIIIWIGGRNFEKEWLVFLPSKKIFLWRQGSFIDAMSQLMIICNRFYHLAYCSHKLVVESSLIGTSLVSQGFSRGQIYFHIGLLLLRPAPPPLSLLPPPLSCPTPKK